MVFFLPLEGDCEARSGGLHVECEIVDMTDEGLRARFDGPDVDVARGPGRAAIVDAAALPGLEPFRHDHAIARGDAFLHVTGAAAYELVDAAAESQHRHDCEHRE